jgi:hypothetical protein
MAESIREAEAEYKKKQAGVDVNREMFRNASNENAKLEQEEHVDAKMKQSTAQMTQDIIDGAMNSKSLMKFDGSNISVELRDVQKEADETAAKNKEAIH